LGEIVFICGELGETDTKDSQSFIERNVRFERAYGSKEIRASLADTANPNLKFTYPNAYLGFEKHVRNAI
jgi:hypothetical protein